MSPAARRSKRSKKFLRAAAWDAIRAKLEASGCAGPPLLDKAVQHVLRNEHKKKSVEEGTHEISNGKTYRVIKGDHLGGNVNFKYRGYNSDLKEMGIKHWTQK